MIARTDRIQTYHSSYFQMSQIPGTSAESRSLASKVVGLVQKASPM